MTISTADYQIMLTNLIEALSHFVAMTAQYDDNDIQGALDSIYRVTNTDHTIEQLYKQRVLLSLIICMRAEARKIFDADEVLAATAGRIDLRKPHGDPPGIPPPAGHEWEWRESGGWYCRPTTPAAAPTPADPTPAHPGPAWPPGDLATRPPQPTQACLPGWAWHWNPALGQWVSIRTVDESTKQRPR